MDLNSHTSQTFALASAAIAAAVGVYWASVKWRINESKVAHPSESRLHHRSLVSVEQLTLEDVLFLVKLAEDCRLVVDCQGTVDILKSTMVGLLFYEPSTRTRCSFETAVKRLGGEVVSITDITSSSIAKGESFEDTVRMFSSYCDAIVLRHPNKGSAERAARLSKVPIVNAGDGVGQHPTQALLDFFTIQSLYSSFFAAKENEETPLTVAFAGDLKNGRTVHSLAPLLAMFNVSFIYIAPTELQFPEELEQTVAQILEMHGRSAQNRQMRSPWLEGSLASVDILYMTRIQRERFSSQEEYNRHEGAFTLTASKLERLAKPTLKVLHPLPRLSEISIDVDATCHAAYFEQAQNGLYMRMAILCLLFGKVEYLQNLAKQSRKNTHV